ncbi:hypothetical protein BDF22DRAFT_77961 [Syncephalis plumigaleata]|nr:hypothetical protein BDF22DRAFT_77961 [Syncephalis plumigaleata]
MLYLYFYLFTAISIFCYLQAYTASSNKLTYVLMHPSLLIPCSFSRYHVTITVTLIDDSNARQYTHSLVNCFLFFYSSSDHTYTTTTHAFPLAPPSFTVIYRLRLAASVYYLSLCCSRLVVFSRLVCRFANDYLSIMLIVCRVLVFVSLLVGSLTPICILCHRHTLLFTLCSSCSLFVVDQRGIYATGSSILVYPLFSSLSLAPLSTCLRHSLTLTRVFLLFHAVSFIHDVCLPRCTTLSVLTC